MRVIKTLLLCGVIAAVATVGYADINLAWTNPNGYWSTDDTQDALIVAGGDLYGMPAVGDLDGDGTPLADNVLVDGLLVADFGGSPAYNAYGASVNVAAADMDPLGFVVARVFQANSAGAADVEGIWYYDGLPTALQSKAPSDGPQIYNANQNRSSSSYGGDPIDTGMVIPEPATLALLGLGALTALWRRRR